MVYSSPFQLFSSGNVTSHVHYTVSQLMSRGSDMLGERGASLELRVSCAVNLICVLFWFHTRDMRCLRLTWHHVENNLVRTQNESLACPKSLDALASMSCSVTEHGIFLVTGDALECFMESK